MCIDEHILGEVVEVHDVVLLDVHLVDGPSELTNMITTFLICHVYIEHVLDGHDEVLVLLLLDVHLI